MTAAQYVSMSLYVERAAAESRSANLCNTQTAYHKIAMGIKT
jgi:hypothetical protein